MRARDGSFVFALPTEYAYNVEEYKYLKFKVYMPAKSTLAGNYSVYQRLWPRFMNYMWAFSGNSSFGQEYWARSEEHTSELQSLMRISYAVFCLKKKKNSKKHISTYIYSIHDISQ